MSRFNFLFLLTFYTCFAKDPPQIQIPKQGTIVGTEVSKLRIQRITAYYGIPYAQPPVNNLRFAPPVTDPLPAWDGERATTDYYPSCLQTKEDYKQSELPFLQLLSDLNFDQLSEDCLYLNVFVPQGNAPKQGFATIIWFHPGNFTTGTPAIWNPHTLVYRQRVIIVTVAYRVNIMGFFTTMDGEAPGNFGLMDQQAAMLWVKNNIELFGGNPDNICLMGYGTGATSVGLHMINQDSRTLFNKAIAMSGNFLSSSIVKYPQEDKKLLDKLASSFGCIRNPTSQLIDCLRRADAEALVQQTSNIDWRPLIDFGLSNNTSPFLPELPKMYFERGDFHKVPLLTGYTNMEQVLELTSLESKTAEKNLTSENLQQFLSELVSGDVPQINETENSCMYNYDHIMNAIMFFYGPSNTVKDPEEFKRIVANFATDKNYASPTFLQASYISKDQPTYVYRFDMKPSTPAAISELPDWVSVPHLFDLLYVWGVPYWKTDQEWDIRDKRISDTIMSFWTNFAKSSDPTENSIYPIKWDAFTKEKPGILIIDGTFNMSNVKNLNYKAFEFWNEYYPKVLDIATQCCSVSDSGSTISIHRIIWIVFGIVFVSQFCIKNY